MTTPSLLPPRRPLGFVAALLGSYQSDVSNWLSRLSTKYAVALGFVIAGAICMLGALAVALAALFRWIEIHYSETYAYAALFALLFSLGIITMLVGLVTFKRRMSAFPKGERQIDALTTTVNATAHRAASVVSARASNRPDAVTTLLAGSAAAVLAGWLFKTRRDRGE
jgi:cytochrome c biogenesis factor